jgi:UDP-2,4-diacetamido-2,4,6-trideoxy-beta-L-altropyranose hydrolase
LIYFRCDVSEAIGWGHLKRCLALAKHSAKYEAAYFLFTDVDEQVLQLVKKMGLGFCQIPNGLALKDEIKHYPDSCRSIVVDLGHRGNLDNPDELVSYFLELDKLQFQIVVIDGLNEDSFRSDRAPRVKAVVQPYWGVVEGSTPPNAEHWLYGPEYVLTDELYYNSYKRRNSSFLQNILVTFGGSDPQKNTINVLHGISHLPDTLNIRVIVGPSFSVSHKAEISLLKASASVEVIFSPENLLVHYNWADVCLCGSGTSRYEAAANGLPVIFASIYPEHDELSRTYASFGTAQFVGTAALLSPRDWAASIMELKASPKIYEDMVTSMESMKQKVVGGKLLAKELHEVFKI